MESANVTFGLHPPRPGWFRRNWLWFLPLLILVAILGGLGAVAAPMVQLKSTEPYRMAFEQVRKSPEVTERLGEPVADPTWLPTGSVYSDGSRGDATLGFSVAGPKGRAHVSAQGRRIAGQWGLTKLEVTFADGRRLALDSSAAGGSEAPKFGSGAPPAGGEAPKWQPGGDAPKWPPSSQVPATGQDAAPIWTPAQLPDMKGKG